MHMSDTHYTFDVAPSSIPIAKHAAFVAAVLGNKAVSKLIQPPKDPAFRGWLAGHSRERSQG